ncbi:29613_t:CDS:2, partial [Gigaspora margarita]
DNINKSTVEQDTNSMEDNVNESSIKQNKCSNTEILLPTPTGQQLKKKKEKILNLRKEQNKVAK